MKYIIRYQFWGSQHTRIAFNIQQLGSILEELDNDPNVINQTIHITTEAL